MKQHRGYAVSARESYAAVVAAWQQNWTQSVELIRIVGLGRFSLIETWSMR